MNDKTITISEKEFLNIVSEVATEAMMKMREIAKEDGKEDSMAPMGIMMSYASCGAKIASKLFNKEGPEVN